MASLAVFQAALDSGSWVRLPWSVWNSALLSASVGPTPDAVVKMAEIVLPSVSQAAWASARGALRSRPTSSLSIASSVMPR